MSLQFLLAAKNPRPRIPSNEPRNDGPRLATSGVSGPTHSVAGADVAIGYDNTVVRALAVLLRQTVDDDVVSPRVLLDLVQSVVMLLSPSQRRRCTCKTYMCFLSGLLLFAMTLTNDVHSKILQCSLFLEVPFEGKLLHRYQRNAVHRDEQQEEIDDACSKVI